MFSGSPDVCLIYSCKMQDISMQFAMLFPTTQSLHEKCAFYILKKTQPFDTRLRMIHNAYDTCSLTKFLRFLFYILEYFKNHTMMFLIVCKQWVLNSHRHHKCKTLTILERARCVGMLLSGLLIQLDFNLLFNPFNKIS